MKLEDEDQDVNKQKGELNRKTDLGHLLLGILSRRLSLRFLLMVRGLLAAPSQVAAVAVVVVSTAARV
jgi:hypothetical protein